MSSGDPPTSGLNGPDDETRAVPVREGPGEQIGRYKLLQQIGEGGFGLVFVAEQVEPVRRQVALKIVKLGMDTRQVVARFEQERQALALMDHPDIARVLDAGATDSGRPYFVMELVKGEPITGYCDRHALAIPDRLRLFERVCLAVQHAHQKGLIHRDLKPSNILVADIDGQPQPKIIDFGIAKATAGRLTGLTLYTEQFQLIGTPEYMSPEQAAGSLDIDTRTDIYALGVVLYELITGTTPFSDHNLRSSTIQEMQRILREVDPPGMSRRVSQPSGEREHVAARRGTDMRRLAALVRGELDWIVSKAIDKDPNRRYDTAKGLALDVRRYLDGDAVLAAPPGAAYRARKFVARHKATVAAAAVVAMALVVGLAGTLWQASVASRERDAARREAANAQAVTDFVIESLNAQDPTGQGRQDMSVAEAMRLATGRLDGGDLKDQPDTVAVLRRTIARVLNNNGKTSEAIPIAEQSLALEQQAHRADHLHVAESLGALGGIYLVAGRLSDAETALLATIAMHERLSTVESAQTVSRLNELVELRIRQGKFGEAGSTAEQALATSRRLFPGGHRVTATALNNLAVVKRSLSAFEEAEALFAQALDEVRRQHPGDHPDLASVMANLANARRRLRRFEAASQMLDEALAMNRRLFKGDHPNTAAMLMQLGQLQQDMGKLPEAETLVQECVAMMRRLYPGSHPLTARALDNLAAIQLAQARASEAVASAAASLAMQRAVFKGDQATIVDTLQRLARAEAARGRRAAALGHATEAAEMAARLAPGGDDRRKRAEELLTSLRQPANTAVPRR